VPTLIRLPIYGEPEPSPPVRAASAWLAMGFRPFFLAAALHAAVFVPWWMLRVGAAPDPALGAWLPMWRHAHEMLFGFALAVIAGFLLTAVRNWTARDTAHGGALAALLGLWLAGRVAMLAQAALPSALVAAAVLAFPLALLIAVGRPILAARSVRNYGILALLGVLTASCAFVHLRGATGDAVGLRRSLLTALQFVVLLNVVVGGRVIPMFTWVAVRGAPVKDSRLFAALAIGGSAALAFASVFGLTGAGLAALAALAGLSNLARLWPWLSRAAARAPMVAVLHLGYLWIGLGQLLLAAAHAGFPVAEATALHALTIGVIGTMTLGMMARVTLGHTGRPVVAKPLVQLAFALMAAAPVVRLASLALPARFWQPTVQGAGVLFALAFALYLLAFTRTLLAPRPDGQAG
jgi:uncharacterized protein involved in response to NO